MDAKQPENAPKFRLRFLLQEFDLTYGDTLIGRGEDCHITIFDPSISRRHACIRVDGRGAALEDLGSRNGCRVNGAFVKGRTDLSDGDRIRIGRQELVFSDVRETSQVHPRQTGSICYCGTCRAAYAKEMDSCPHCGSAQTGRSSMAPSDYDEETHVSPSDSLRRIASAPPSH